VEHPDLSVCGLTFDEEIHARVIGA
jgi:hypothetical protein